MNLALTYSGDKPVENSETDFLKIFENLLFFTFSMKKFAFFLVKPTKSMLETLISIKTQLKIEWK
jgi:hypothetical protein